MSLPGAWPRIGLQEAFVTVDASPAQNFQWLSFAARTALGDGTGVADAGGACDLLQAAFERREHVLPSDVATRFTHAQLKLLRSAIGARALVRVAEAELAAFRAKALTRTRACPVHGRSVRRVRLVGKRGCTCR